jgi:hypothetical protein
VGTDSPLTQLGIKIDGLVGPFWAEVHVYGHKHRDEEEILRELLSSCFNGEEYGTCMVTKIGDSEGLLWQRRPAYDFTWEAKSERAPWPSPYQEWDE